MQFLTKKKKKYTDSKAVLYSLHNKAETFKLAKENERNTKISAKKYLSSFKAQYPFLNTSRGV